MSELRTYDVIMTPSSDGSWVLKSEADKVIAEKDKEIRHHKYKRCLDKAKICEDKLGTVVKPGWWNKWYKRWLELAEKFKEGV